MLSGPIDIDKMDYLFRDSLHAGVPYGRHFDQPRLIGSLCLNASGDGLAISEKGKTAAELLVFARYVMFSEVYWHHGVRSATAMLQRAFDLLRDQVCLESLFGMVEGPMIAEMRRVAGGGPASDLLDGIFGPARGSTNGWPSTVSWSIGKSTHGLPAARTPGWSIVPNILPKSSVVPWARALAITIYYSTPPPWTVKSRLTSTFSYSKDACYRSLGDVFARRSSSCQGAIRRLRQARADLHPSRDCRTGAGHRGSLGLGDSGD